MPVTAHSSSPSRAISLPVPAVSGIPSKAERLLALGDNYRPNLKRASTEQNRLGALLEAQTELRQTLAGPVNAELVDTQDWTVEDLFPHPDALHYDRSRDLYYDSAQVPLHVSQQTSASAMRDMGLHKHAPTLDVEPQRSPRVLIKKNDHAGKRHGSRSALGEEYAKKGTISNLFSTHKARSPPTLISPPPTSQTASSFTHGSESPFAPDNFTPEEMDRPLETTPIPFQPMPPMNPSRPLARPDEDVLKGAKKHIRRPPKGIRNWFDGFDISSDDESYETEPPTFVTPDPTPFELPGSEVVFHPAAEEFAVPPKHPARRINGVQLRSRDSSTAPHNATSDPAKSSRDRTSSHTSSPRKRASRGPSERAGTIKSMPTSEGDSNKRPLRSVPSRMATESVLSMSSSGAEDYIASDPETGYHDDAVVMLGHAAPVDLQKVRPRQLTNQTNYQRKGSTSTEQTASPMPVRLASLSAERPRPLAAHKAASSDAESNKQREKSAASSHYSSPTRTGSVSTGQPTDGPRMMEVTEEEMILLELMRNQRAKRAAKEMQGLLENHPGGLEQKAMHQARRQHYEQADEMRSAPPGRALMTKVNDAQDRNALLEVRRYSFLKNEDVDRELNINRFLAQESAGPPALYDDIPESSSGHDYEHPRSAGVELGPERARADSVNAQRLRNYHDGIRQSLTSTSAPELVKLRPAPIPGAHQKSEDSKQRPDLNDQEDGVPTIPDRSPDRPSPTSCSTTFEHDTAVPPTPIEDVRQSYCPSLPSSAPLSLPIPAAPVFRQELDDATTTDASSQPRESPRMIIANAFSKLPRPIALAQSTRSFTSPPSARPFHEFKHPAPDRNGQHSPIANTKPHGAVQQQQETESYRNDTQTPNTEISRSFSFASSNFNGSCITLGAVSPLNIRQPSAASFYSNQRHSTQAPTVSFAPNHNHILKESAKPVSPLLDARSNRTSMMSMTSAGEDVLAAWAELGGGTLNVRG